MTKKGLKNRILVFDAQSMRFEDWNGHLRVANTNLTKANVCEYYGFEIKNHEKYGLDPERKYRFLRSPDALEKAVGSFKERPILYVHKAADADRLDNSKVIGTTGSDPSFSYPYIQNSITIWDGDYIKAIKDNSQVELSASYAFTPVMEAGVFEGEPYDGIMTDIYVDHIALVEQGRAGPDVRVADAKLGEIMKKLNKFGLKMTGALNRVLNPSGAVNDAKGNQIAELVGLASGVQKRHFPTVITSLLKGHAIASDEEEKKLGEEVKKVLDEDPDKEKDKVNDEDPIDTIEKEQSANAGDEGPEKKPEKPETSDSDENCDRNNQALAGDAKLRSMPVLRPQATAFDAAAVEQKIKQNIQQEFHQKDEARMLVRPLVGEWAAAQDSGVQILRDALTQATGRTPPDGMSYDQLKFTVDMVIDQKQKTRANDHKPVLASDIQRLGATRLRRI